MAIIKTKEIHGMSAEDLTKRLAEFRLEIAKDRGQIAVGGSPANAGKMRATKKTIARILTELTQKKILQSKKVPTKAKTKTEAKK
ncbi:MAG TPA: 50S ribosomal protein L29 [archaeon]|nr:50S ribosomal protein L29 [archaeon]